MRGDVPRGMRRLILFLALLAFIPPLQLAGQSAPRLRGVVLTPEKSPVPGVNVFIVETLEGALTDSVGRFSIALSGGGLPATLLARRVGFQQFQRVVTATDTTGGVAITLTRGATSLAPITVQAGAITAGNERGATLTSLEVVTTPGTAADINRAIQLLPGVQPVDDGTALFVRGGDYTETKVFINEAVLLNPAQLLTPSGTFVGTVDPFQLDGIFFSSGGFGARYGNALSGVVGLRTRGTATRHAATLGGGLAAWSADGALRASEHLTLRVAGNRNDLSPFLRLNSNPRGFAPPPRGRDLSASATYTYGLAGEVKVYTVDQTNVIGIPIDDPGFRATFDSDVASNLLVATWKDVRGAFAPLVSVSRSRLDRREGFGAFNLNAGQDLRTLFGQLSWERSPGTTLRLGAEVEHLVSDMRGSVPGGDDRRPGARTTVWRIDRPGTRTGAFVEGDLQPLPTLRIVPGLRADRSTLTGRTTLDPRVNAAWQPGGAVSLTAAWGIYHQVPDPLFYSDSLGRSGLPSMRAEQRVLGVQWGEPSTTLIRVEAYEKHYRDLSLLSRDNLVATDGVGRSRGMDLFFKGRIPGLDIETRTTLNLLRARRTAPETGTTTRAAFDVPRSYSFIAEKLLPRGWRSALTWRTSSGRPYTPVASAAFDTTSDIWVPRFGVPNSGRFPDLKRLDLSASWYRPLRPGVQSVLYLSLSNVFDRDNTQGWKYSDNYRTRTPVRSIFNRSVYFGASLIWQ